MRAIRVGSEGWFGITGSGVEENEEVLEMVTELSGLREDKGERGECRDWDRPGGENVEFILCPNDRLCDLRVRSAKGSSS